MSNGLDLALMKDPFGEWSPEAGDRHTDVAFSEDEWHSFFFETLGVAETEYVDGESADEYEAKLKAAFRASLPAYLLLSRIDNFYRDARFSPDEIPLLKAELERARDFPLDGKAQAFLDGMLSGCTAAISDGLGIRLLSS